MNHEFIKLILPSIIFISWVIFSFRFKKKYTMIGAALFLASYVGLSSNFSFVYRELHQLIQLILIALFVGPAILKGRLGWINKFLFVFLLFIGTSFVSAPIDEDAKSQIINFIVCVGVTSYLFSALRSSSDVEKIFQYIATLAVILSIAGCLEFVADPGRRIETTFSNPNYFGLFLGVGFCAVAACFKGFQRNLALILILVMLVASGSRSAIAFPFFYFLWQIYKQKRFDKQIILLLAFLIMTTSVVYSGMTRFSDIDQTAASDAERIVFAKIALRMASSHPFTGIGWGRFISEFGNYSSFSEQVVTTSGVIDLSGQTRRVTHNDFLRVLAELGWVAFATAIALTLYGVRLLLTSFLHIFSFLPPIWGGMVFFSLGHNNLNNALFWFVFLLPFFLAHKLNMIRGSQRLRSYSLSVMKANN
ncbi:O-antigen ligase family protein [Desulfuromonas sp. KJ2020]|uniref:O-antigen ligase family protein n=1 Tax=Desulfuromonas sp. KJ2020 TaxID=2919173 RepID=UPI0020A7ABB8|nr:O-antigen ligase family protein [Desulfuromonas sp. KJ2020]MCP3177492.1 O-antigen ligase family protein [Desulfuromonas sp. KJ2020]